MKQKELVEKIEKILQKHYGEDVGASEILFLINQHTEEVIGEFEDGRIGIHTAYYNESATNKEQNARNELRVVQLKRARL